MTYNDNLRWIYKSRNSPLYHYYNVPKITKELKFTDTETTKSFINDMIYKIKILTNNKSKINELKKYSNYQLLLENAVEFNDENIVAMCLTPRVDVNLQMFDKNLNLLHLAVKNNNYMIARLLLERGAEVNACEKNEHLTALHMAIANDNMKIIYLLFRHKACPNATSITGITPLYVAISMRSFKMVEYLIKFRADVNPKSKFMHKSPLFMAVDYNCPDIVDILLKNGASIEESRMANTTILNVACRLWSEELLKIILKYDLKGDVNVKDRISGKSPLHIAIEKKNYEIVKLLLNQGADTNEIYKDHDEMRSPLSLAVHRNDIRMTRILLKYGARKLGNECLSQSIKRHNKQITNMLLSNNVADINELNKDGLTPVHIAIIHGYKDMVKICLEHGAVIAPAGIIKIPIMFYAIRNDDLDMIDLLISEGASVNQLVDKKTSLLDVAIRCNSIRVTKLLLQRGAVINVMSSNEEQEFALKYIVILEYEGKKISRRNGRLIGKMSNWGRYHEKCRKEIESMKNQTIVDNITFYDLLIKDEDSLAAYTRNDNFISTFPRSDYKRKFPIYADTLAINFTRGRVRNSLLEKVESNMTKILDTNLPNLCVQKVTSNLSNDDLRNIIMSVCGCKLGKDREILHLHKCLPQLMGAL